MFLILRDNNGCCEGCSCVWQGIVDGKSGHKERIQGSTSSPGRQVVDGYDMEGRTLH